MPSVPVFIVPVWLQIPSSSIMFSSFAFTPENSVHIEPTLHFIPLCNCPWCPQILGVSALTPILHKMLSYVEALASSVMIFGDGRQLTIWNLVFDI